MGSTPQMAYMARFDEPTFCPSEISSLLSQYPLLLSGNDTSSRPPEDVDESDDEAGGVPLSADHDVNMPDALARQASDLGRDHHFSGIFRPRCETEARSDPGDRDRIHIEPTVMSGGPGMARSMLHYTHPRPETPDIWAEEDSRRLRFALDGNDISDVPRFAVAAEQTNDRGQSPQSPHEISLLVDPGSRSLTHVDHNRSAGTLASQSQQSGRSVTEQLRDIADTVQQNTPAVDEEWLDVDDHRRTYDFADFVDSWRLRAMTDKTLPQFEPEAQELPDDWRPSLRAPGRHYKARTPDPQGIDWDTLGASRRHAMKARVLLHPTRQRRFDTASQSPFRETRDEPSSYHFRRFTPQHRARFCHYQLRNVLAAPDRANIFYANRNTIRHTSLATPSVSTPIADLNLRITCLASTSTHLLAGGFSGEYALLSPSQTLTTGFVTHASNGLVTHISPTGVFCSNDHHVRLLDLGTDTFTSAFEYPHAINCSATSSRLRVLVGDDPDALITDAEKGTVLATLRGHTDHAFACAWHAHYVATGAQDGRTLVWDARNWSRPLVSLPCGARSLHFAEDTGALIVAEDEDVVRVYEGGDMFRERQDLSFFGAVGGVAVLGGGDEVVIANVDETVGGLMSFERRGKGMVADVVV